MAPRARRRLERDPTTTSSPGLWFKYNILTESTRLPFSVAEHAAFSLPRVILASRCIKFEGGAMSTVNEYHAYARDCFRWAPRARTEEQRERLLSTQKALSLLFGPSPGGPPKAISRIRMIFVDRGHGPP